MPNEVFSTMVSGLALLFFPMIKIWIILLVGLSILMAIVLIFVLMMRKGLSAYL